MPLKPYLAAPVIPLIKDPLVYWNGMSHSNDPVALILDLLSTPGGYSIYYHSLNLISHSVLLASSTVRVHSLSGFILCQGSFSVRVHSLSGFILCQGSFSVRVHSLSGFILCQGSFSLRSYYPSQGHTVWPELMSFSQSGPSSNISSELCSGMFDHTWHSGHSSVWSWSLRIITVLACLCDHILSTCPSGVSPRVAVALS